MTRDELVDLLIDVYDHEHSPQTAADAIVADHAVIRLPAEASENVWTNDVTGDVYVTVEGRFVVLAGDEWLTPDEVRHYAAALLAAARKAKEQS